MKILHLSAECTPLAKVGGLADAVYGLARAQKELGADVEILLPKYDTLPQGVTSVGGVPLTLLESKTHFERGAIYGFPDDIERFLAFSQTAANYIKNLPHMPDIVHLHDWHVAATAAFLHQRCKIVLTLHNMAYRGETTKDVLTNAHLPLAAFSTDGAPPSLLRGGIFYSDLVTTVSPTYADEIRSWSGKDPLATLLSSKKFCGILNGIDYDYWNPTSDPHLPHHFAAAHLQSGYPFLSGKAKLKAYLRQKLSLPESDAPLIGCVTRLTYQKGPELIKEALLCALENKAQFVLVGAPDNAETLKTFSTLQAQTQGKAHLTFAFDEPLSHLLYGAADLILVPSLFEPCGLTQMIAMRYGALPLVRSTGGLADTVFDNKNGFTFLAPTPEAIRHTLHRSLSLYATPEWHSLLHTALTTDFSWTNSAQEYLTLYKDCISHVTQEG